MRRSIIALMGSCFLSVVLQAQPGVGVMEFEQKIRVSDRLVEAGSYYNAAKILEKAHLNRPNNLDVLYQLAHTYHLSRDYENASFYFEQLLEKEDSIHLRYPLFKYEYGAALKYGAQYVLSKKIFNQFINEYKGFNADYYKSRAKIEVVGCEMVIQERFKNARAEVKHLNSGINTKYTEYAPIPIGNDGILYSSMRNNKAVNSDKEIVLSQIYISKRLDESMGVITPDDDFALGTPFAGAINSDTEHVGHGCFSGDMKRFYFTKCPVNNILEANCNIYMSQIENGKWASPTLLDKVNIEGYKSTTPYVYTDIDDTDMIYFSSNRPGSMGGSDIWWSRRMADGSITEPKNMGGNINSVGDDITPFWDEKNEIFYFSSNGHPGLGGFDVFYANRANQGYWDKATNMGYPINTSVDDTYFVLAKNKTSGYLVSNRLGSQALTSVNCCDDIFKVDITLMPTYTLSGTVRELGAEDSSPLLKAKITLTDITVPSQPVVVENFTTSDDGYYDIYVAKTGDYLLKVEKEGYNSVTHSFSTRNLRQPLSLEKDFNLLKY